MPCYDQKAPGMLCTNCYRDWHLEESSLVEPWDKVITSMMPISNALSFGLNLASRICDTRYLHIYVYWLRRIKLHSNLK